MSVPRSAGLPVQGMRLRLGIGDLVLLFTVVNTTGDNACHHYRN
ncbi:hypothetical protein [Bacillus subtilis]|nr:hypothetical protein [Bacillus subtilis]